MIKSSKMKKLAGFLQQLLYSPKGAVEGFLMIDRDTSVQVALVPGTVDAEALAKGLGLVIEVSAKPDHSPKTKEAPHPVFHLLKIRRLGGKAFKSSRAGSNRVEGVVKAIHYAKHGEPNGVILETGEFIHTRPHGMKKLKLRVGATVVAQGERRMTVLGTGLVEARKVNRVTID